MIYRFESNESDSHNFWVLKCFIKNLSKDILKYNMCSDIILGIIFFTFIGNLIFCVKEHN